MKLPKLLLVILMVLSAVVLTGCKKDPAQEEPVIPSNPNVTRENVEDLTVSKSLSQITSDAKTWGPILKDYYGQQLTDFKFRDIQGKAHNISDYKGKKLMIVLWATWCMPCKQEIPHLIALRNIMDKDELAIVAISTESEALVKRFAAEADINYTVAAMNRYPDPLNRIRGYPTAFFIDPEGKIKIITEGTLHLGEMKSILLAD